MRIRRLPRAVRDADEIWDWIAADNIEAADRFSDRIQKSTDRLTQFPQSGSPHPEVGPDVRGIVVGRYLVLYRVGPDSVDIVRVVHGARDLAALWDGDGEERSVRAFSP